MQHDIEPTLAMDEFAIDLHVIALRRLRAEVGTNATVQSDATGGDQLIAMSPRTEPGCGEETVQAHGGSTVAGIVDPG